MSETHAAPAPAGRRPLMALDDALSRLMAQAQPLVAIEDCSTFDADGRVLARDLVAALTVPPADNSAMDGYAVRTADCTAPGTVLRVAQRIPAGSTGEPLAPSTAARIFTGAPIPPGADAVVMQEDTEALPEDGSLGRVRVTAVPQTGQWIRRAGEDVERGNVVLAAGQRLTPQALGLAASIGFASLPVRRRPRVAMLSTGDELVMPGTIAPDAMPPGAIYNSNRFFLRALLLRMGCEVQDLGLVPDRLEATIDGLRAAASHNDLIITTGGVSVGEEDHVKAAVQSLGTLEHWSLDIKPGKPFAYGAIARPALEEGGRELCHVCGLPGNPVSSFMTFLLLVRPFLMGLLGTTQAVPDAVQMTAGFDWPRPDRRREFLRARIGADGRLALFSNQSSGVLTSTVWGDGVIDNPGGQAIAVGDTVRFISFSAWLA